MIVSLAVAGEGDGNLRVDAGAAVAPQIIAGIESDPVHAGLRISRQIAAASVGVGDTGGNLNPAARRSCTRSAVPLLSESSIQPPPSCFSRRTEISAAGLPSTVSNT